MAFRVLGTKIDWVAEAARPVSGDALVIPANDHLWMLSGPGLELKKSLGKEIEIEAVRQGPVEPGTLVATPGTAAGYRFLLHAAVMGQDMNWIPGAGAKATMALVQRAGAEKLSSIVVYPLYRGAHGRREEPAREMLNGFLEALQRGSSLQLISILFAQADEKQMLHETFLRLLGSQRP